MMICDEWKALSHDYVFGDLSDPARELLDRHAGACASCLVEARLLKLVDRRLLEERAPDPPAGLTRRALEEAPSRLWRELRGVAAALLVAGALGVLSLSVSVADRIPEDVRAGPRILSEAVSILPQLLALPLKE